VALSEAKRVATEPLSERSEDMLRSDRDRAKGFRAEVDAKTTQTDRSERAEGFPVWNAAAGTNPSERSEDVLPTSTK